jgi:hypothetical protein
MAFYTASLLEMCHCPQYCVAISSWPSWSDWKFCIVTSSFPTVQSTISIAIFTSTPSAVGLTYSDREKVRERAQESERGRESGREKGRDLASTQANWARLQAIRECHAAECQSVAL